MAISKQQPMRSAEIELVGVVNRHADTLETHQQSLNTLADGLADEILDRENADTTLNNAIESEALARGTADDTLQRNIDNEALARSSADDTLQRNIDNEALARSSADTAIHNQIGDGFTATTVTSVTNALTSAVQSISNEIGSGFSTEDTIADAIADATDDIESLQGWQNRFRIGLTSQVTIPANDSVSDTFSFGAPFDSDAEVAVYPVCVAGGEILTNLDCTLISATYSGFSWSVANSGSDSATVKVGFLAVRMN